MVLEDDGRCLFDLLQVGLARLVYDLESVQELGQSFDDDVVDGLGALGAAEDEDDRRALLELEVVHGAVRKRRSELFPDGIACASHAVRMLLEELRRLGI